MPDLVCDTDFLMKVTNEPVPKLRAFLDDYRFDLIALPSVVRELKGLSSKKKGKTSRYARNALKCIQDGLVKSLSSEISGTVEADLELVQYGSTHNVLIATLDGALLSEMEKKRVPYMTLRNDAPLKREFRRATYLTTKKPRF
jgi:rRNA-processing protein FCF1